VVGIPLDERGSNSGPRTFRRRSACSRPSCGAPNPARTASRQGALSDCAPRRRASSTNPATWGLFADAVEAYAALRGQDDPVRGPVAGVGCVLVQDRETSCIDLDRVIDEHGTLDVRADTIVGRAHSFTELSPGGRGLHVFILGAIPKAIVGDQIEIYSTARSLR
jgi:primase-polymerase (primpol)-like protein